MNFNINLNLYKYFYEVAKYNSFTKAAEFLMISQPSLSYSIKVLENQLGKRLFNRNNHNISLTDDGKVIFEKLSNVFKVFDDITNNLNSINGKIILGVRSAYASKILPFYMNEIIKIYPNLEIEFVLGKSDYLYNLLLKSEIDILIDEYYHPDKEFISFEIEKFDTIFFTTKNIYENIKCKIIDLEYCSKNKVCIVKTNRITREIKAMFSSFNFNEFQSTPLMISNMVEDGMIGINPRVIIEEELNSSELIELKTNIELPKAPMVLTYLKRFENQNIKAVTNFFKEHNFYQLLNNK